MKLSALIALSLLLVVSCGKTASREDYDKNLNAAKAALEMAQKNATSKKQELEKTKTVRKTAKAADQSNLENREKNLEKEVRQAEIDVEQKRKAVEELEKLGPPQRKRL